MVDGGNYNGRDDHRHRPDQGGAHLFPRQDRLPAPGDRLCGSRRRAGAVLLRPDRRQPQLAHRRGPSGQTISAADCAQVAKAVDAVEFRTPPTQCNFQPLLAQDAPAVCPPGTTAKKLFVDNFENGTASADRLTETHRRNAGGLHAARLVGRRRPAGRPSGPGVLRRRSDQGGTCAAGRRREWRAAPRQPGHHRAKQLGPAPRIVFDHWVATEAGWDGGNVKISVNGGAWQVIPDVGVRLQPLQREAHQPCPGQHQSARRPAGLHGHATAAPLTAPGAGRSSTSPGSQSARTRSSCASTSGTDGCGGTFGWYVDDLQVVQCR